MIVNISSTTKIKSRVFIPRKLSINEATEQKAGYDSYTGTLVRLANTSKNKIKAQN